MILYMLKKEGLWKDSFNTANLLSLVRLICLPPFLYFSYLYGQDSLEPKLNAFYLVLVFLFIAAISDFLDGFIARLFKQKTQLGVYLDPLCDKIFIISSLGLLSYMFYFPWWAYLAYLIRECLNVYGGIFLFYKYKVQGKANLLGKLCVTISVPLIIWYLAIPLLKTKFPLGHWLLEPIFLTYLWLGIGLASIIQYINHYLSIKFFVNLDKNKA